MTALDQATEVVDPVPGAGAPHLPQQPDLIQLLTPEGERVEHPDYSLDISDDELRGLYRDLALVRRWDVEATALQRQGELGIWASLLGQEAAQVGAGRALQDGDMAFPTYREHGVAWTRGVDPLDVISLFRGVDNGGWDPVATGFNLYTVVIGAQCLHATGYAMGVQRDGAENAVLAFLGDGATSQGEVNEAMIFAASFSAPVVFFCQNNQYAISVPLERQTRIPLFQRAAGFGFPGVRVDGNDVLAVLAVTRAALAGRPRGPGPDLHRGVHLPDGRAHHLRRPHPLPAGQRAGGVEAARPDRPAQGLPVAQRHRRRRLLRLGRGRGRRAGRPHPQRHERDGRSRRRPACSTTSTPSRRRRWPPSGPSSSTTTPSFEGGEH